MVGCNAYDGGTIERNEFESNCEVFILGEQLKAERLKAGMTQEQLAAKIGTKKAISHALRMGMRTFSFPPCLKYFRDWGEKSALPLCNNAAKMLSRCLMQTVERV